MKKVLIVNTTRLVAERPTLKSESKTIVFQDLEKGRRYVKRNKENVTNVQYGYLDE